MTVTLPDQDTDAARQLLEQLDDALPCDNPSCDRPAEWIIHERSIVCGCTTRELGCTPCKDRLLDILNAPDVSLWECFLCGDVRGPTTYRALFAVDLIEPLR